MAYRVFTEQQIEKFFQIYIKAPLREGKKPCISHVATKAQIARSTVVRLKNQHDWEKRRKKIISGAVAKVDKQIENDTAKKLKTYIELEKAGLNHLISRVDEDGRLSVSPSELVTISKHVQLLAGEPDSRPDGARTNVVVYLPEKEVIEADPHNGNNGSRKLDRHKRA